MVSLVVPVPPVAPVGPALPVGPNLLEIQALLVEPESRILLLCLICHARSPVPAGVRVLPVRQAGSCLLLDGPAALGCADLGFPKWARFLASRSPVPLGGAGTFSRGPREDAIGAVAPPRSCAGLGAFTVLNEEAGVG